MFCKSPCNYSPYADGDWVIKTWRWWDEYKLQTAQQDEYSASVVTEFLCSYTLPSRPWKTCANTDLPPTLIYERYWCMVVSGFLKAGNHSVIGAIGYCKLFFRLFRDLYFSVRSSRSSAFMRPAAILYECQNYLAGVGWCGGGGRFGRKRELNSNSK